MPTPSSLNLKHPVAWLWREPGAANCNEPVRLRRYWPAPTNGQKTLDLNISFVWDYLQNPQTKANGTVPQQSDLRLTLGVGVKF